MLCPCLTKMRAPTHRTYHTEQSKSALFNKSYFKCLDHFSSIQFPHVISRRDVISSGPEPVCASYFVEAERGALPVVGDNPSFPGSGVRDITH